MSMRSLVSLAVFGSVLVSSISSHAGLNPCEDTFARSRRANDWNPAEVSQKKKMEGKSVEDLLKLIGVQDADRAVLDRLMKAERRLKNRRWWSSAPLNVRELKLSQSLRMLDQALRSGDISVGVGLIRELFLKTETAANEILVAEITIRETERMMSEADAVSAAGRERQLREQLIRLRRDYGALEGQTETPEISAKKQDIWGRIEAGLSVLKELQARAEIVADGRADRLSPELKRLFDDIDAEAGRREFLTYEDLVAENAKARERLAANARILGANWREYSVMRVLIESGANPEGEVKAERRAIQADHAAIAAAKVAMESTPDSAGGTAPEGTVRETSSLHLLDSVVEDRVAGRDRGNYQANCLALLARVGTTASHKRAFKGLAAESGRPPIREIRQIFARHAEAWIAETQADTSAQRLHNFAMPILEKGMSAIIWAIDRVQYRPVKDFLRQLFGFAYRYRARTQHFPLVDMLLRDRRPIAEVYKDAVEMIQQDKSFIYGMARYSEAEGLYKALWDHAKSLGGSEEGVVIKFEKGDAARKKYGVIPWKTVDRPAMIAASAAATAISLATVIGWDKVQALAENPTVAGVLGALGVAGFTLNEVKHRAATKAEEAADAARIAKANGMREDDPAAAAEEAQALAARAAPGSPVAMAVGQGKSLLQSLVDDVSGQQRGQAGLEPGKTEDPDYDGDTDGPVAPGQP